LDSLANVNCQDCDGNTPLHFVKKDCEERTLDFLLKGGADPNRENKSGMTPIHVALMNGSENNLRAFLHARPISKENTALHLAVKNGRLDYVKLLAESGSNLDCKDADGKTPLEVAQGNGKKDIADFLKGMMELRKQVTSSASRWVSSAPPLHAAVMKRQVHLIPSILASGIDINCQDSNRQTALHIAAKNDFTEIVELLLSRNAKTDITDKSGKTAFYCAVEARHIASAKLLKAKMYYGTFDYRSDAGCTSLHVAANYNDVDLVRLHVDGWVDINRHDNNGNTALHIAAMKGSLEICKILVEDGKASLTEKNKRGETPIDVATPEVRQYLKRKSFFRKFK